MGCAFSQNSNIVDKKAEQVDRVKQNNAEDQASKLAWQSKSEEPDVGVTQKTFMIGVHQDEDLNKSTLEDVSEENIAANGISKLSTQTSVLRTRNIRRNLTMMDFIPQIPQHFVQPMDYEELLSAVFSSEFLQSERGICMLDGPSGSGKTTLMLAMVRTEKVKKRFLDGVIWINLTEASTIEMAICQAYDLVQTVYGNSSNIFLGDQKMFQASALSLVSHVDCSTHLLQDLVCMLGGRAHLIVLDNVWDLKIVSTFKHLGVPLAITTRNMELNVNLTIQSSKEVSITPATILGRQTLGKMHQSDIAKLFEKICGMSVEEDDKLVVVIEETSHSPLEMVLLAGLVRQILQQVDENTFSEVVSDLPKHLNQVKYHIQLQHAVAVSSLSQGHLNLWRTAAFVFEFLGEQLQRKALALALLPKGHHLPLHTLQTLWQLDGDAARQTLDQLAQHYLLQRFGVESQEMWIVHDLVLDFLKHRVLNDSESIREFHRQQLAYLTSPNMLKVMYRTHNYSAVHLHLQKLQEFGQEPDLALERPNCALDPNILANTNDVNLLLAAAQVYIVVGRRSDTIQVLQRIMRFALSSNEFSSQEATIQYQLDAPYLLACILQVDSKYAESLQFLKRCYDSLQKGQLTVQYQALVRCYGMYADLLLKAGDTKTSRVVVQQLIGMLSKDGNMMGSLWLVRIREIVVQLEMCEGNFEMAELNAVQGITTVEQFLGRHHPFIIRMLHCHANTCYQLKKWTKCQSSMCRAFAVAQGVFGIYSVEALRAMNELAVALLTISKAQDALQVLKEAQQLAQMMAGQWSLELAYIIGNQAVSQLLMGNSLRAWKLAKQSLEILEKIYSFQNGNKGISNALHCLAVASADMNNYKTAQELIQKCIDIRSITEQGYGEGTSAALESYGCILIQAGQQQQGVDVLTECVDISNRREIQSNRTSGSNFVEIAKPLKLLSQAYADMGDKEQAEMYQGKFQKALQEIPEDHPSLHWLKKMEEHQKQVQLYLSHQGVPPVSDVELEGLFI
eukprot:TRINITY_DN8117_c0_g1_i1.p1 TRINITY_DN8117_c0_g1~~TRINITY_DN8117_c0_g1_i1.p1  ORF type:complete len:1018 (-),score=101.26 TRINITY_DN8117_c0_g1_i1:2396-5449(-)